MEVVNRIAKYLDLKPIIKIVGLKNGEKMHEELYDGPILATKFNSISRSIHSTKIGLAKEVRKFAPSNNAEARAQIEKLTVKYFKT